MTKHKKKLYGRCFNCKRNKFFISTRTLKLPLGLEVHGRELICGACYNLLVKNTTQPHG